MPLILVTNDDGIHSQGLRALVEAVRPLGDVVVVAPDKPQSSMGHAITVDAPIRIEKVKRFEALGVDAYQCTGTPVDCVKLAIDRLLSARPDLCVSGINHGLNASINVIYSGTLSAAMEAAIEGVPAAGFSLDLNGAEGDFTLAVKVAREISAGILKWGLPADVFLNVNIPYISVEHFKGYKVCRQAKGKWQESYEERVDPRGRKYYWLTGVFVNYDRGTDTDLWALASGYVSIVPVELDFTAYHALTYLLNRWEWQELGSERD